MRIAVASDHAGFVLKVKVAQCLTVMGRQLQDLGTGDTTSVDYPDFAEAAAAAIRSTRVERAAPPKARED